MTDRLTIGIRFALYADLMLLFGVPIFCLDTRWSEPRPDSCGVSATGPNEPAMCAG